MTYWWATPSLGKDFIKQLAAQNLVIENDDRQILDSTARAKYSIAVGPSDAETLAEQLAAAATGPLSDDLLAERDCLSRLLIDTMERCAVARAQTPATVAEAIDRLCNA